MSERKIGKRGRCTFKKERKRNIRENWRRGREEIKTNEWQTMKERKSETEIEDKEITETREELKQRKQRKMERRSWTDERTLNKEELKSKTIWKKIAKW